MSTEYDARCLEHDERWPDGGVTYQVKELAQLVGPLRSHIVALAAIPDLSMSLLGAYSDVSLETFLTKHAACDLLIYDEYNRPWVES